MDLAVSVFYDAWLAAGDHLAFALRVDLGGNDATFLHAQGASSIVALPTEDIAIHAGVEAGYSPVGLANVGLRGRIGEQVELGGGWWFPLYAITGVDLGSFIRPTLDLKVRFRGPGED